MACTSDPVDPDTYDTRAITDSIQAAGGVTIAVDTTWAGQNYYDFDGNPVITVPDSVPEGDAGEAV